MFCSFSLNHALNLLCFDAFIANFIDNFFLLDSKLRANKAFFRRYKGPFKYYVIGHGGRGGYVKI